MSYSYQFILAKVRVVGVKKTVASESTEIFRVNRKCGTLDLNRNVKENSLEDSAEY